MKKDIYPDAEWICPLKDGLRPLWRSKTNPSTYLPRLVGVGADLTHHKFLQTHVHQVYQTITESEKAGKKLFAVLVDPDKFRPEVIQEANKFSVDFIFIGGSRLKKKSFHRCINYIHGQTDIPLVIFPGSREQISEKADAILLLSLISGRNPDYLIGEHIRAAQQLKKSNLEVIPTGYLIIGGGKKNSTQVVSRTLPIKTSDVNRVISTAIAGELLGMKMIYLEAGSGTKTPLPLPLVRMVRKNISSPILAGGGINSPGKAIAYCNAGVDVIVVGNAIEKNISLVGKIAKAISRLNFKSF